MAERGRAHDVAGWSRRPSRRPRHWPVDRFSSAACGGIDFGVNDFKKKNGINIVPAVFQ
ncbi:unnamed protein product [Plutella xylostella]|uniref:(diamondback moth) hypothetical protein n=1 Tax=Plutella xylostella TaxID=51655 RepID=A0A8S4FJR4_PLUXY|nr:unnamed protein product [Plutella xylostella]